MTLNELFESFIYSRENGIAPAKRVASAATIDNYKRQLKPFLTFMMLDRGRLKYEELTSADVKAYVSHVNKHESYKSVATRLTMLRVIRTLFKYVEQDEGCQEESLKSWGKLLPPIPKNPRRERIPTPKELKHVKNIWDTSGFWGFRNYVAYCFVLGTGQRISEICWTKLEHLQLDNAMVYVPEQGKTGSRLVPVDDELVKLLKVWLKRRAKMRNGADSPWLFVARGGRRCTKDTFGKAFRKVQQGSDPAKRITPHTLRHAFGTYYLRNDGNIERLRMIIGHQTYDTLKGYLHLAQVGSDQTKAELNRVSPLKMLNSRTI
jgi:site-specific recombinase XerD